MKSSFLLPFLAGFFLSYTSYADILHHDIQVNLSPDQRTLEVQDTVTLPRTTGRAQYRFALHDGLQPVPMTLGAQIVPGPVEQKDPPVRSYAVEVPEGVTELKIRYFGSIYHPLSTPEEEYARGFSATPGLISNQGIYLAGSSVWYPQFQNELVTFSLEVMLPNSWDAVSQGERAEHAVSASGTRVRWVSSDAQDEIFLIAGKFVEYAQDFGNVKAFAFLQTPDPELAAKYLAATSRYIEMYDQLIGKYPYSKFALVENFWETGYGMPSFTLLGPKIIRFPFIINSSYPHEILHNWWGNSVLVNYESGNWCEGLTAYLADHLIKEQQGGGNEYRRSTLQKYTDYVSEQNDFPLSEFKERYSSATEAVGYGKALMFYHMLRQELGDRTFTDGVKRFYQEQKFRKATFSDLQSAFEAVSGRNLSRSFEQWVNWTGAPELKVSGAVTRPTRDGYELTAAVEQLQAGAVYDLEIPLAVSLEGKSTAYQTRILMNSRVLKFKIQVPGRPYRLEIDPEFDLFRRLNRYEIPPALSQGFGSKKVLAVIPSGAPGQVQEAYRKLAKFWQSDSEYGAFEIKLDSEIQELPADRSVWILGAESRFAGIVEQAVAEYGVRLNERELRVGEARFDRAQHSFVLSARHPGNPAQVISWVAADPVDAVEGLTRKLPHYGKYSYLVFEGAEPKNVLQGIWPSIHSPMSIPVAQPDGSVIAASKAKLAPRPALIEMPAMFSESRLRATVDTLTQERFKGRELGTPELDEIAEYIASQFSASGLRPAGEQGYFQSWSEDLGAPKGRRTLTNVVAMIPGRDPGLEPLVVGAHYDHLGLGWPDVHEGDQGKIHAGADDNASGVAILLEVSRYFQQQARNGVLPERNVLFVAFTGEEAGLLGSRHFVRAYSPAGSAKKFFAMLNLDTVGRLGSNKLMIFGVGTAREWPQLFTGIGYVTAVPMQPVASDPGSSDQRSFQEAGIPAVQFFSGANLDYHRPTDTSEKLDLAGMLKVAAVVKETAEYLATRKEPLTAPGGSGPPGNPDDPGQPRKVFLGTVPDFAFAGSGVRVASVVPDSPAAKAGLVADDVIIEMNAAVIRDLKSYAEFLKTLKAGDRVTIGFLRAGLRQNTTATVIER